MKTRNEKIITALELTKNLAPFNESTARLFYGIDIKKFKAFYWDFEGNLHCVYKQKKQDLLKTSLVS